MPTASFLSLDADSRLLPSIIIFGVGPWLVFTFIIYKAFVFFYNRFFHPLRGVPGPFFASISPLWQELELVKSNHPFALKAAHERYGPVIRIAPNELHFASPTALRQIYTQGKDAPLKFGFYENARPIKEDHLFSFMEGQENASSSQKGVTQLTVQFNDLISKLALKSSDKVVDFYQIIHQFTFEAVYLSCFEQPLGMMRTGEEHVLRTMMVRSEKALKWQIIFPVLRELGKYLPGSLGHNLRGVHEWKKYYISQMEVLRKSDKSPFLSQLLDTVSEEHNRPLNESEAAEELIGLMFAGSGTSAATINWLLWELASNPSVQEQLFEEISQLLPSPTTTVDYKTVTTLPFLKAVINETLRLHTAIIGNLTRIAVTDMVIDGQKVPKGTVIGMSSPVYHSNSEYFFEPEKWNPSRWLTGDSSKMTAAFAPFSVGPRSCIGQSLALSELTVMVPSLCRRFKFSIPEGYPELDMTPLGVFATHPRGDRNTLVVDERIL